MLTASLGALRGERSASAGVGVPVETGAKGGYAATKSRRDWG